MSLIEIADALGGEDKKIIDQKDKLYCDKLNHFLRSLAHQQNHSKHSKQIIGPSLETPRTETLSRLPEEWAHSHFPIIRSRNQK